jgi:trans-aconitate methyltransferase
VATDHAAGTLSARTGPQGPAEPVFDGELYAANTAHHRAFDHVVLADAGLFPGARVLDLGCGSGDLTASVAGLVRAGGTGSGSGRVLGLDSSPAQIAHARRSYPVPGLAFRVGRAQQLAELVPAEAFDVVLSVAVLHWVPATDQPRVLSAVVRALRPGGVFRAELGGAGQIAAARVELDQLSRGYGGGGSPWFFPEQDRYHALLTDAGLTVLRARLVPQRRSMPGRAELVGWLRSQVLPAYLPGLPEAARDQFVAEAVAALPDRLRRADRSFDQDYVRMDLLARRP